MLFAFKGFFHNLSYIFLYTKIYTIKKGDIRILHIHKQMCYQQCFSFSTRVLFCPSRLLSLLYDLDNPTTTITLPEAVYVHIHIYFYIVSLLTHIRLIYLTDDFFFLFFFLPTTGEISLSFVWVYLPVNERGIRYNFRGPYAIITQHTYVYKIH